MINAVYIEYEKRLFKEVQNGKIPHHVAIIMDGNRRFAQNVGFMPIQGHLKGMDTLEDVQGWCQELGVKILTVYAFSSENIKRDAVEIDALMKLFTENFRKAGDDERVHKHKIRIKVIGEINFVPESVQEAIRYAEGQTKDYNSFLLNVAFSYGSRNEIVKAVRQITDAVKEGKIDINDIDEKLFSSYLYTNGLPDPDLVLRTSGERRISNFLLWQSAYSDLYFTDINWPAIRKIDFLRAIRSCQQRKQDFIEGGEWARYRMF